MIDKNRVESILKVNGLTPTSDSEQIQSVLLSARYSKDEVDTAIMVMREDKKTNETRVDGLHKVFRTDNGLTPKEISKLLGIDIAITDKLHDLEAEKRANNLFTLFLTGISVALAILSILMYMYIAKIGLFHPTAAAIKLTIF